MPIAVYDADMISAVGGSRFSAGHAEVASYWPADSVSRICRSFTVLIGDGPFQPVTELSGEILHISGRAIEEPGESLSVVGDGCRELNRRLGLLTSPGIAAADDPVVLP